MSQQFDIEPTPIGIFVAVVTVIVGISSCVVIAFGVHDGDQGLMLVGGGFLLISLLTGYTNYLSERREDTPNEEVG